MPDSGIGTAAPRAPQTPGQRSAAPGQHAQRAQRSLSTSFLLAFALHALGSSLHDRLRACMTFALCFLPPVPACTAAVVGAAPTYAPYSPGACACHAAAEAASCFFQQPLDLTSFCRQPLEHTSPSGHPTYRLSSRVLTCRRQPVVHGFARCSQLQGAMPCRRLTHAPCPAFTGRTHAAKPWLASLLAERPGLTEAPHAFGERYVGEIGGQGWREEGYSAGHNMHAL